MKAVYKLRRIQTDVSTFSNEGKTHYKYEFYRAPTGEHNEQMLGSSLWYATCEDRGYKLGHEIVATVTGL